MIGFSHPSKSSPFLRNFLTLFFGSVIAQAIPLLAAPFLARLFSPNDFGIYEAFTALATVIAVAASMRYELAIVLPQRDEDAFSIMVLAAIATAVVTVFLSLCGYLFHKPLGNLFAIEESALFFLLTPFLGFWLALIQIGHYWFTRRSRFAGIASRRVVQNGILTGTQLATGTNHFPGGCWGLITGALTGTSIGALWFFTIAYQEAAGYLRASSRWDAIRRVARRYREFPLKNLPAHLLNIVANQLPSILFIALFDPISAGFYALTRRVLATPLSFLADAVTDIFRQRASEDYHHRGTCRPIFMKTLKATLLLSLPPFLVLLFFAPPLFAFVFGEQWREAGRYAQFLAPMYAMRFLASPLGFVLIIAERQNFYLGWQITLFFLTIGALAVGWATSSALVCVGFFSGFYTLLYGWLILAAYHSTERKREVTDS